MRLQLALLVFAAVVTAGAGYLVLVLWLSAIQYVESVPLP